MARLELSVAGVAGYLVKIVASTRPPGTSAVSTRQW
jgi:hypothetical protein